MDVQQLAEQMYDAYGAFTDWKTFDGRAMPATFAALGERVQGAWTAAAQAALDADKPALEQSWKQYFDERSLKEIEFAADYAANYHHGTDGHIRLMTIAALAGLLDRAWKEPNGQP